MEEVDMIIPGQYLTEVVVPLSSNPDLSIQRGVPC